MTEWITTNEASQKSGYHPEHLRRLIREGKIEGQKFGIVWMVNLKSLLKFMQDANKSNDKRRGAKHT